MNTRIAAIGLTAAVLTGCGTGSLGDNTFQTGSSTLTSSSDRTAVYAANVDEGTVTIVRDGVVIDEVDVGAEPTRIARAGNYVFATLRAERGIAVLAETADGLEVVDRIDVGAEPFGLVATERGDRIFATISQEDRVIEIDVATREVTRTWAIGGEPRWLALHPSNQALFIGSTYTTDQSGPVARIDLLSDEVDEVPLPPTARFSLGVDLRMGRVTGDLGISPDGKWLGIPVMYIDTETQLGDSFGGIGTGLEYYGGERNEPAVALFPTTSTGGVWIMEGQAVLARGVRDGASVGSYPTSVTFSPDSDHMMVTAETSDIVSTIYVPRGNSTFDGFSTHGSSMVTTGRGPRGVVFTGATDGFVHTFIERGVANVNFADAARDVDRTVGSFSFNETGGPQAGAPTILASSALPINVEEGRKMFYSSVDRRMAGESQGISCSTCHFDGRNDGITWPFADMDRNTPSLAGQVSRTTPVTWTDNVETVADEAQLTSGARMGGSGISDHEAGLVAAYIDFTRHVDRVERGVITDQVTLGQQIFERDDVGCATCHVADSAFTDTQLHPVKGNKATRTPTLIGIGASAPYFHDGSASTLRGVLEYSRDGAMGDTSMLSGNEMDALEAFLKSL